MRQDVPKVLLELLFVYDWNNFVHHLVEEAIRIIVDSTSAELKTNACFSNSETVIATLTLDYPFSYLRAPS